MTKRISAALAALCICACGPMGTMDAGTGATGGGSTTTGGGSTTTGGGSTGGGSTGGGGGGTANGGGAATGGGAASGGGSAAGPFPRVMNLMEQVPVIANETTDLEVDGQGRLHVVTNHTGVVDGGIDYSIRATNGTWTTERVITAVATQSIGTGVKIELDSNDQPHLAFTWADIPGNGARTRLFYAARGSDAGWNVESIEDAGFQISSFFGFQLHADEPHFGYRVRNALPSDGGTMQSAVMRWATRANATGAWTLETIEEFREVTGAQTIAVTSDGTPNIFYRGDLPSMATFRTARRTAPNTWVIEDQGPNGMTRTWAVAVGNDVHVVGEFSIFRRINGVWSNEAGATAGNNPVILALPNSEIWDFTNVGSGTRDLRTGRFVNGMHDTSFDAGVSDVRYSGWSYDTTTQAIWGSVYRTPGTNDGVYVVRLP